MFEIIKTGVTEFLNKDTEGFSVKNKNTTIITIISFVILYILVLLFGQYLWNNILVTLVPAVKPVTSVFQLLGLTILLSLILPH